MAAYTVRRLKTISGDGSDWVGLNGSYLRVKINKSTRIAIKVKPSNWSDDAIVAYNHYYPNDVDVKKKRSVKPVVEEINPAVVEVEPECGHLLRVEEVKEDCCICCCELPKATATLECGHTFCTGCILTWFKQKNNCPMCRAVVEDAPQQRSVGRVHISEWHANDLIDLTNKILNGQAMGLMSAHTNTRVGFEDIYERYRTRMLARASRRLGANGHRFAQALVEVTNRLAANVHDDGYTDYFTSENH